MTLRGHRSLAFTILLIAFVAVPLAAQSQDDQIRQLESRLDELIRQAAAIRAELDQLKGTPAPVPSDDLTAIDVVTPPPPATPTAEAPSPAAPALTDVQPVANQSNPAASKALNPDMSVIGNFLGHAGQRNEFEFGPGSLRSPGSFEEAEVALEAFVDPYAKAKFFLGFSPEGVEIEEGYAQFVSLPYGLTAKAGKVKALFGKANTWHTHIRPWVDQPLVIHNFFGDDGLADSGLSVSKVLPVRRAFVEVTGEVLSGDVNGVFGRRSDNDLLYNSHLKIFRDLSESSNVEVGASYARGTLAGAGGPNELGGIDATWRWKPLERAIYRSLIVRFEGMANRRDDFDQTLRGFYASADYQLARRWFAGVRVDRADRHLPVLSDERFALPQRSTDRGLSATLTFWPSEFSQLRGQFRRTSYDGLDAVNELLFQLQFAIGAHGAHTF